MAINLTDEQSEALRKIKAFMEDDTQAVFVLRGSAGTGKTTLIAKLVDTLAEMSLSCALLAPTGRAARILSNKVSTLSQHPCNGGTIHRAIYALSEIEINEAAQTSNDPGMRMYFPLKNEEPSVSLFIIDESSMVGDKETHGDFMQFGTGRLLKDLITYARINRVGRINDHLTKLLFVGDAAQLPPVGENISPALSDDYLRTEYQLHVSTFDLKHVMRQAQDSSILERATKLRDALFASCFNSFDLQPNQQDIKQVESSQAVERVVQSLRQKQPTVAIVYSNAAALEYNLSIREQYWGQVNLPLQVGDTLLINKNSAACSLSNGDLVKVMAIDAAAEHVPVYVKGETNPVDLWFRGVTVAFRDANNEVINTSCKVLENLLESPQRELLPLEQRALLVHFRKRHSNLKPKSDAFKKAIRDDSYFNALQVKYGYAMTCHKAQGGEWNTVIVAFDAQRGARNADFFRWAYTAITRAAKQLVVVNPPAFTPVSTIEWEGIPQTTATTVVADSQALLADPDWLRFAFTMAIMPLMQIHQQLRGVWGMQGIDIEQLQHLQYCERYTLMRQGTRAVIQYHYNGKFQVGKTLEVPHTLSDKMLAENALTSLRLLSNQVETSPESPFIAAFLERLDTAISNSAIKRNGYKVMPYRLRINFLDNYRKGEIDFTYDGKQNWTSAQAVGGVGATQAQQLYQDIQRLMQVSEQAVS